MTAYEDLSIEEIAEIVGPVYDRNELDDEPDGAFDLRQMSEQRVIVTITTPNYKFMVPAFCFHDDGTLVAGIPETLHRLDPRDLHIERAAVWLATPNNLLDNRTPIQLLKSGAHEIVLTAAAAQQFGPPPTAADTRGIAPLPHRDPRRALVDQVGPIIETGRMADFFRWPKEKLAELLDRRHLLTFTGQYGLSSPGSMWDYRGAGLPRLREIMFALDPGNADPIRVAIWLNTPHYALDGQPPADVLKKRRAQDAVTLAYRTAAATRLFNPTLTLKTSPDE